MAMKTIAKTTIVTLAFLMLTACKTTDLLQTIATAAASVAAISDPAIAPYLVLAEDGVNCAVAPGTTAEKIDGCLATALQNYQLAFPNATKNEQAVIAIVITAIEGYVNDQVAELQTVTAIPGGGANTHSKAKAQVKNPNAHAPTAKQFKKQFNAAAKTAGLKQI